MLREGIPKNGFTYYWDEDEQEYLMQTKKLDLTKATFINDLIPIAESRLENIK